MQDDRARIQTLGRIAGSALQIHRAFLARPLSTIKRLSAQTGLSAPGVTASVTALVKLGLVREVTGRKRGRVFAYHDYLALLQQGDEPL